ncbi:MAG: hydrogenase formation protein HypD [Selenomonadaceae bacterium]|nr:hydrogenase formation protein HypD [Selenomonadaceae bacterium]
MADTLKLVKKISRLAKGKKHLRLMEVCGTHTVAIFRSGIRQILPENVELVSGPGCPVCVTDDDFIDKAIAYARKKNFIVATFGDMLKVPGTRSSLARESAAGARIKVVYSPLDCIELAKENPRKSVIFLAVGFETTAPTQAATILAARDQGVKNLFMLSAQKLVPPALKFLLNDESTKVDGFLLPGHVAVVIGADAFNFLADDFKIPSAVSGFEADEILTALVSLLEQIDTGQPTVANDYKSVVTNEGNLTAKKILAQVYEVTDAVWRGMGEIPASGLKLRDEFAAFDIERVEPVEIERIEKKSACRCGEVLRGLVKPTDCPLFGKACKPLHAIGACMVSVEGVCAAWFKYGSGKFNF